MASHDVIIVGGGVIGSAIAYFLASDSNFNGSVVVVEKDPTYATCSTALSAGGFRQQFSVAENIQISLFGVNFFKNLDTHLRVGDEVPDIGFVEAGYLVLATEKGLPILKQNHALQRSLNADVSFFDASELANRFPWLFLEGIAGGCWGRNEGWIDAYSLLQGFARKAKYLGVTYLTDQVIELERRNNRIVSVTLASQQRLNCRYLVNAAGPRANMVAEMAGVDLPVRPRKRFIYTFECAQKIPNMPLLICPNGVYARPEGAGYLCGVSPPANQDPDSLDFTPDDTLFEQTIWPTLAERVPAFESLRHTSTWAGHYAYNTEDQNAIVGPHPEVENLLFANGFSGHGLQQSPGVGRAVSELIIHGAYQTLDLTNFGYERFATGRLLRELNVI